MNRLVYLLMEFAEDYGCTDKVLGICASMNEALAAADEWSDDGERDVDIYEVPLGHFIDGDMFGPWYRHPDCDRVEQLDVERYEQERDDFIQRKELQLAVLRRLKTQNPLRTAGQASGWPYSSFGQNTRSGL